MKIDIRVGDKLIEINDNFIGRRDRDGHYFKVGSYNSEFTNERYYNSSNEGESYIEVNDIKEIELIVDYISFKKDILIIKIIPLKGIFTGTIFYCRCAIKHCFIKDPMLKVDLKYRRLKTLEYLDI